jgi:hypothetical protein
MDYVYLSSASWLEEVSKNFLENSALQMVLLKDFVGTGMISSTVKLVGRYLRQQMDTTFVNITSQLSKHSYLFMTPRTKVSPIKNTPSPAKEKSGK